MIDFSKVKNIALDKKTLTQTKSWLREEGLNKNESFVLWAGYFKSSDNFCVDTEIFPEQTSFRSDSGIGVYVSGDEIHSISKWLYVNKKHLIAQVHSHPTHAFHSDTDDTFPLVTSEGQFSIVVPYFARSTILLTECAIYRLVNSKWININNQQINSIFTVV